MRVRASGDSWWHHVYITQEQSLALEIRLLILIIHCQHSPFRKPNQVPSVPKPFHGGTALSMKTVFFPKLYIRAIRGPWHAICIQLSGGIHRSRDPWRSGTPLGSREQDQSPGVLTPGLKLHPLIPHPPRSVNLELARSFHCSAVVQREGGAQVRGKFVK